MSNNEKRDSYYRIFTVPNLLSALRILLVVPFVLFFLQGKDGLIKTFTVLLLSGLTDAADGFIARKFHQQSKLGELLDPIADKLTQGVIAICMIISYANYPAFFCLFGFFICKELMMACGGIILWKRHKRPCAAKWYGKVATVLFYLSVVVIFMLRLINHEILWLVWVLTGLTLLCMAHAFVRYTFIFFEILRQEEDSSSQAKKEN